MKRLIAAGIILALLIAACLSSSLIIKEKCNNILILLESDSQIKEAEELFLKSENLFCFFANRSFIEEIEESFARLSGLNQKNDFAHYNSELQELKLKIEHLKESEQLKTRSFF